jgi:hypothetical protein
MSSRVSMPTDSRTMSGVTPEALLVGLVQLAVGGRCRMDHQGLGVADVGQVRTELQGVDEALAGRWPPSLAGP